MALILNHAVAWMPAPLRVPVLAGLIVFIVAVGTTQVALQLENREADQQTEKLARIYLDGLAASIAEPATQRDWGQIERRFRAAFREQEGVAERALFLHEDGLSPLAQVSEGSALAAPQAHLGHGDALFSLDEAHGLAWASRTVGAQGGLRLVAALDIAPMIEARRHLLLGVVAFDLFIAGLCGLLASFVLRRLNRPIEALLALLQDARGDVRQHVPPTLIAGADKELATVLQAYNAMIDGLAEREALRADIAERSRAAALGRLAATMAHEVRNPLGGLSTAVGTLRKFGDDSSVRDESLAFLSRGIEQIDVTVNRMLNLHRPEEERRLTRADFEDLKLLIRPAAIRKQIHLDWQLDLPDSFEVGASGVRQVLLNLLLNACAASPQKGTITLAAFVDGNELVCTVVDDGRGMDTSRIEQLMGIRPREPAPRRIGLDTVVALLGSLDAKASVEGGPGGGARVRIAIPITAA